MLNIDSISKGFGEQQLFNRTSLQINPGERIGLVGRNGHGKTTLLNIIANTDHPDDGKIIIPSDYQIGFLSQKILFQEKTVIEECMNGLPDHEKDFYWKAEKVLAGLGFSTSDFKKDPEKFSGGFQVRLNLAKVLISQPDLLILDEPTNYLDITSIRWITSFLISWPREILLVTHDRGFMDNVVTHIAGIHRTKIRKIKGNTQKYYEQIALDEEVYEQTRLNEEKRTKEIQTFINRFRAKARLANMVQSRVKTLSKLNNKDKLEKIPDLEFSFKEKEFSGKQILKINNLSFSYKKDNELINNFSLTAYPNDRIAIIGKNGKGKTTLLKLIAQKISPATGSIVYNPGVFKGYFEQTNVLSLNESFTVEEELINSHPDFDRQAARNICGAMMFTQDNALKKISILSGGEKSRVMLGKLLLTPLNLILLDEPSNHLDIESCDSLMASLSNFHGTIIIVTHNEMLLNSFANRLIVFKKDKISIFEGSYEEFLEKEGWDEINISEKMIEKDLSISKKEIRKKRSLIISKRSKELKPFKTKITKIEDQIDNNENIINEYNLKLIDATKNTDVKAIEELSIRINELENEIEYLFIDLEDYTNQVDSKSMEYELQLKEIEEG